MEGNRKGRRSINLVHVPAAKIAREFALSSCMHVHTAVK